MILGQNSVKMELRDRAAFDDIFGQFKGQIRIKMDSTFASSIKSKPIETFDLLLEYAAKYANAVDFLGVEQMGMVGVNIKPAREKYFKTLLEARKIDHINQGAGIALIGFIESRKPRKDRAVFCSMAEFIAEAFNELGKKAVAYREQV